MRRTDATVHPGRPPEGAVLPLSAGGRALHWQPVRPALVPAWHRLSGALLAMDGGNEAPTRPELLADIEPGWVDAPANSRIALDDDGEARAFCLVTVRPGDRQLLRAYLSGGVHPDWRGAGVGRALLAWGLDRGRAVVAARRAELGPGPDGLPRPAIAFTVAEREDGSVVPLARRLGLDHPRYFAVMQRSPAGPLPDPPALGPGLRVVGWRPELDEPVRLAHNEAFTGHWLFQPWEADSWQRWQTGAPGFRPAWSHVALDGDGRVAGYTLSREHPATVPATTPGGAAEGWTDKIGVLPAHRGRGLARALLTAALRSFAGAGLTSAGLDVDTGNTTNAIRLYTGLGYTVRRRSVQLTARL